MENAKKLRKEAKRKFTRLENIIRENIQNEGLQGVVHRRFNELLEKWQNLQEEHDKLISLLENEEQEEEEDAWLTDISNKFYSLEEEVHKYLEIKTAVTVPVINSTPQRVVQLEKMRFQPFNGDIRKFPKFKEEFTKHIQPLCGEDQAAFVLKSYLTEEIRDDVDNVEENIDAIWERLNARYGNTGRLVDTILADIKNIPPCNEDDSTLFLINTVEKAFRDLERMNLENEINNSTIVAIIEEKLPSELMKEWIKLMVKSENSYTNKFPKLFELLMEYRNRIEYQMSDIRSNLMKCDVNHVKAEPTLLNKVKCWLHKENSSHPIWQCNEFQSKTPWERLELVKANNACYGCLESGHTMKECRRGFKCRIDRCQKNHNDLLHEAYTSNYTFHSQAELSEQLITSILQLQVIKGGKKGSKIKPLNVLWDTGSTLSFITLKRAAELKLVGKPITIKIMTVGGESKLISSNLYKLNLLDKEYNEVEIEVIGLLNISNDIAKVDLGPFVKLFNKIKHNEIHRPENGQIDVLMGYQYAAYHPVKVQAKGHLIFLRNQFGGVIAGSHKLISEKTQKLVEHVSIYFTITQVDSFFESESLGITCNPKCGSCKCGRCHPGGKDMSLEEESEYELIKNNLKYDETRYKWKASYPWIRDPKALTNNKFIVMCTLKSTEKRLLKNEQFADLYKNQMNDMFDRKVARKITEGELNHYKGPKYYIAHHAVLKPDSKSTPCRIVFNSSAKYQGLSLNDYYAKGPSLLNQLLGILLRFRRDMYAFVGDISKMFHSIEISLHDQMTHLFLWRNLEIDKEPETYAMTAVNMGDRPSSTIAQAALRQTAEMQSIEYREASDIILRNSYMDDILGSVNQLDRAKQIIKEIDDILYKGGFTIKAWAVSGNADSQNSLTDDQKKVQLITMGEEHQESYENVLGMKWDVKNDLLMFLCEINQNSAMEEPITKRKILSIVNSIYDPMGLLTPFTVKFKVILRTLWANTPKLDWDDSIPEQLKVKWFLLLNEISQVKNLAFPRSITPLSKIGYPSLILFSDASCDAYGAVAFARWKVDKGYECRLIAAKSRIAPLKINNIVRLELCGAVVSKRLRCYIEKEIRVKFEKVYHIVDSEIVKAMINKSSYGFNTFAANRIGEIHQATSTIEWYWIEGKLNVADWVTRGKSPCDLNIESIWQKAPAFLQLSEDKWPIHSESSIKVVPESKVFNFSGIVSSEIKETLSTRININRFSQFHLLINTTARILKLYKKFKEGNRTLPMDINPDDIREGLEFWLRDAQRAIIKDVENGKYVKLCPQYKNSLIVVGGRTERWMHATWNKQEFILLPSNHRISELIVSYEHKESGHLGTASTIARVRSNYWIIGIRLLVKKLIGQCIVCKKKLKMFSSQVMSPLPIERLQPSPPFTHVGVDYFGPFQIRGEVQKRVRGKCFGVIFTCLVARAIYVDITPNYSTDGFLQTIRKFSSIRGWPKTIHSDRGTQLMGASKVLKDIVKNVDWGILQNYGHKYGTTWLFSPADGPWYNGATESLVKSVKRALNACIGEQVLSFSELQMVLFEASQLVNQRPIGDHPSHPNEETYLTPNDLVLGRASNHVPQGPFKENVNFKNRFTFLQQIIDHFWKRWIREIFPKLLIQPKWHVEKRNLKKGDVVLVQDANVVRGEWKMAIVREPLASLDGKIRKVILSYRDSRSDNKKIVITRPVQRLIVLVTADD